MLPSAVTLMLPPAVVRLPSTATAPLPAIVPAATVIVPAPVVWIVSAGLRNTIGPVVVLSSRERPEARDTVLSAHVIDDNGRGIERQRAVSRRLERGFRDLQRAGVIHEHAGRAAVRGGDLRHEYFQWIGGGADAAGSDNIERLGGDVDPRRCEAVGDRPDRVQGDRVALGGGTDQDDAARAVDIDIGPRSQRRRGERKAPGAEVADINATARGRRGNGRRHLGFKLIAGGTDR